MKTLCEIKQDGKWKFFSCHEDWMGGTKAEFIESCKTLWPVTDRRGDMRFRDVEDLTQVPSRYICEY